MTEERQDVVVASPLTVAGVVLALLGLWRGSRLFVLAGGIAIGAGLKLHPPGGSAPDA